jgi:hypothetical protein
MEETVMLQRLAVRSGLLVGAVALSVGVYDSPAMAAPSTASSLSVTTVSKEDPLTGEQVTVRDKVIRFNEAAKVGHSLKLRTEGGTISLTRTTDGTVVTALPVAGVKSTNASSARGFCYYAARAAIYTIGAAVFAGLAATGGGIILGVAISARAAGAFAAALTGGAGLEALIATYFC